MFPPAKHVCRSLLKAKTKRQPPPLTMCMTCTLCLNPSTRRRKTLKGHTSPAACRPAYLEISHSRRCSPSSPGPSARRAAGEICGALERRGVCRKRRLRRWLGLGVLLSSEPVHSLKLHAAFYCAGGAQALAGGQSDSYSSHSPPSFIGVNTCAPLPIST